MRSRSPGTRSRDWSADARDHPGTNRQRQPDLSAVPDQAIPLRRRRLCDPVGRYGHPVEHACRPVRHRPRLRRAADFGRGRRDPDLGARRNQPSGLARQDYPGLRGGRRQGAGRAGRGPVEPVPSRDGPRPAAARGGNSGLHRRVPRRRQPGDAARAAARDFAKPGDHGDLDLCGRGGRPSRRGAARRLRGQAEASLRLHVRPAQHRRRSAAVPGRATRSRAT